MINKYPLYPVFPCETIVRPIPGLENYTIDIYGTVTNTDTGYVRKPYIDDKGYFRINLWGNNKQKHIRIHRLLGTVFLNCPEDKKIDHINGIRTDNRLENLRISSNAENCRNKKSINGIKISGVNINQKKDGTGKCWCAHIKYNQTQMSKYFPFTDEGKQRALHWRVGKEIELFKEFANRVYIKNSK
jgi:hypothetical protein